MIEATKNTEKGISCEICSAITKKEDVSFYPAFNIFICQGCKSTPIDTVKKIVAERNA